MALRHRGLAGEVVGYARRAGTGEQAITLGAVDRATTRLEEAVVGADLVVLCTPVAQFPALLASLRSSLASGAVVTDVGSVKAEVVRVAEEGLRGCDAHFVGGHPMAGSERTGVEAAREKLFEGAVWVLTPTPASDPVVVERLAQTCRGLGSRVLSLDPAAHDALVSRSSHLPHVLAAALTNYVLSGTHPEEQSRLCATGFRDVTRIASGSPEMWRDIALGNRDALLRAIQDVSESLRGISLALERRDAEAVLDFFATAKRRRDAWRHLGGTPTVE